MSSFLPADSLIPLGSFALVTLPLCLVHTLYPFPFVTLAIVLIFYSILSILQATSCVCPDSLPAACSGNL